MTRNYCLNLYNKSTIEVTENRGVYIMMCTLPSGFLITEVSDSYSRCKERVLDRIEDYENYLEMDKRHYDYELENEYYDEVMSWQI